MNREASKRGRGEMRMPNQAKPLSYLMKEREDQRGQRLTTSHYETASTWRDTWWLSLGARRWVGAQAKLRLLRCVRIKATAGSGEFRAWLGCDLLDTLIWKGKSAQRPTGTLAPLVLEGIGNNLDATAVYRATSDAKFCTGAPATKSLI